MKMCIKYFVVKYLFNSFHIIGIFLSPPKKVLENL